MFTEGTPVVVINKPWLHGVIVGFTLDGRVEVDLGWEENWIFKPHDLELEQRDDFWWRPQASANATTQP